MGERDLMPFGADSSLVVMGEGLCYYQVERCAEVLTHSFGERSIIKRFLGGVLINVNVLFPSNQRSKHFDFIL